MARAREWCLKYRYKFRKEASKTCEDVLMEVAGRHGVDLRELSVMPDLIHAIV